MQPVLNGVVKPADVIAKGPHVYNEATRKYEEKQPVFKEYPRAMWHETLGCKDAIDRQDQLKMESEGWQTHPFPEKAKKETIVAPAADLALIVLQQSQQLQAMQAEINKLTTPEEPKRHKKEEVRA